MLPFGDGQGDDGLLWTLEPLLHDLAAITCVFQGFEHGLLVIPGGIRSNGRLFLLETHLNLPYPG